MVFLNPKPMPVVYMFLVFRLFLDTSHRAKTHPLRFLALGGLFSTFHAAFWIASY
jgi:hypothetical protein